MSLKMLTEITPSAVLIGVVVWILMHWALFGPQIGIRMLRADGAIAQCEQGFAASIAASAEKELSEIPRPELGLEHELSARMLRDMMKSPLGDLMNMVGQQTGMNLDGTLGLYEQQKRRAEEAYEAALDTAKRRLSARAKNAGSYCGCVAEEAANNLARTDFSIYSGTLTVIQPVSIRDLSSLMRRAETGNACSHLRGDQ